MPEEKPPARSLGVSHIVESAQIRAATRALNAIPKAPTIFDVMPSLRDAMPRFEVPRVAVMHANLVRNLMPAMPRFEVPQVAEMHANLVRNLMPAMPRFEVPQVAEMHANLVRNLIPKIEIPRTLDFMPSLVSNLLPRWTTVHDWLSSSLRIWRDLADAGKAAAGWARRALCAARDARDAVLRGDWAQVRAFVAQWLGLRHPEDAHLQAAADALLEPGWEPEEVDVWAVSDLLADLKKETVSGARRHRPVSKTRINDRWIVHLEQPITYQDGTTVTLLDQVRDETPVPEPSDYGFDDDRLNRVLALMSPDERKVCLAHTGPGCTWAEAAITAGFPPEFGETVRRKRTRVAKEVSRRASARR